MTQTIRYCLGGRWDSTCTQWNQHTEDCPGDGCRGCAPKGRQTHGLRGLALVGAR